ncbi:S8/S53 family peptidase [Mucilaginibacter gotjawali]|uniref:Uncharacterized protein n=2 Tax=Mucilaginibacter gotjawali TaxID=1550579 RepID=A0A839S948_9SPHI|nr:S8/S53 family peptidase [Mucilaginibacter gotjawali]MBB3053882.1 hypothetical protein [Mucilaginibacter gotjawali]BAU54146.1 Calcium-dependent protease precursor [Mucilaginibacter gotjawali]
MRKISVLLLILLFGFKAYCQNDYYWSSNKKNLLTVDSSTVVLKTTVANDKVKAINFIKTIPGAAIPAHHFDSVRLFVKYPKKMSLTDVSASFLKNNIKVDELIYAYNYGKVPFVPNGVILCRLKPGITRENIITFFGKGEVEKHFTDQYGVTYITPVHLKKVFALANKLYESGLVEWAHPDFIEKLEQSTNDPNYANQYYLKNTGQTGGTSGVDINVEPAWAIPTGNTTIRVAVIDDGVEAHEDLGTRVQAGYTPLIAAGTGSLGAPASSTAGHGEACAGIIAATKDNAIGIAGICPTALIIPVNIFVGGETSSNIASGINWAWTATQGNADVLSCSWGGGAPADVITSAITSARTSGRGGKGSVVVFAAGNYIPNNVPVAYPASVSGVIAVGAIDKSGNRWNYSPNSPSLVAPSGNINLTGDVYTIDRMGANGFNTTNYMTNFGGTSAACPQAAGVAALMLKINPNLTETQVRTDIINSAYSMGSTVDFGSGRLNAYAAIQASMPVISGVSAFCNTSVLTVSPVPTGATVAWTVSPTGVVNVPTSGSSITISKVSQGWATVTATITGGNAGTLTANYAVTTYPACTAISATMSGPCSNYYQTWYVSATPNMAGATNWHWTVNGTPNGVINIQSPYSQSTYVSVTGGGGIAVTYTDQCGETSHTDGVTIYSPCGKAPAAIVAYPNPASNQLTIQNNTPAMATLADGTIANIQATPAFSVELYNAKGAIIKTGQNTGGGKNIVLNTADVSNGTYYLHVKQGSEVIEQQIIIKH